jgi:hypothetical protein
MDSRTVIKIPSHCLYFCSLHSRLILCTNFLDEEGLLYPSDYIERYEIINSFSGFFVTISYQMRTDVRYARFQYLVRIMVIF